MDADALLKDFDTSKDDEIPGWAVVLMDNMKVLLQEFKGMNVLINKIKELEDFRGISETVTNNLSAENKRLRDIIEKLELQLDDNEQRSRNGCLVIHGVPENDSEDTDDLVLDVINNSLELGNIDLNDIQRSHRLGPKKNSRNTRSSSTNNRPRPIILRFTSYRERDKVFRNKSKLKGSKVLITENLTRRRYELLQATLAKYGKGNTWTRDGRILTKVGERIVNINKMDDLI